MADDLDDLLDEVESKFCKDSLAKKPARTKLQQTWDQSKPEKHGPSLRAPRTKEGEDLNDIIRDICDDDGPEITTTSSPTPRTSTKSQVKELSSHKPKCLTILIGGSKYNKGLCTVSEKKTCDQLRCTSCDFKIVMFDNFQWKEDCDYLFFRNNVPDFQKLKVKLIPKRGVRAYACQCSWRSVADLTQVLSDSKLKWVCGKHA